MKEKNRGGLSLAFGGARRAPRQKTKKGFVTSTVPVCKHTFSISG
jgi:hypothetical protein